jgi:enterochelin esterase-like enzyme
LIWDGKWVWSLAELPEAPAQPWLKPRPGTARGKLTLQRFRSKVLGNDRRVWVYTPPGYRAEGPPCGLLLLFDGWAYTQVIPTPTILDNLRARDGFPDLVAVLVDHPTHKDRNLELSCHPPFNDFLVRELIPWVRRHFHVTRDPARTIVGGSSRGGLAAVFAGLRHPEVFGNVFSQSGDFGWHPGSEGKVPSEPGWLIRQYATAAKVPLRFYLDVGLMERWNHGDEPGFLQANRHLRDVLRARGYAPHYAEFNSGHYYVSWQTTLPDALLALTTEAKDPKEHTRFPGKVVKEQVRGGIVFPPEKRMWTRITGKVEVLSAHVLRYEDGTEVDLNRGMDAPELGQMGKIGDSFYPCGREAAEFLRKLIADRPVTCIAGREHVAGKKVRIGSAFVGETNLNIEMVRNGWAVSHHRGMDAWEIIARENKRGLWRGAFVVPERWRKGERLPGEAPSSESERRALGALQVFEPVVTCDEARPGKPVVALRFRPNLERKVTDDDLAQLKKFPSLRSVDLPSQKITDPGLDHLAGLTQLQELNLNWNKVTAAGVLRLVKERTRLRRLEVGGVKLRDEDLVALKDLKGRLEIGLAGVAGWSLS